MNVVLELACSGELSECRGSVVEYAFVVEILCDRGVLSMGLDFQN